MRIRASLQTLLRGRRPVRFGSLGSTTPISKYWGFDRGMPVDRWYIERFLDRHRKDITGTVLEVKDNTYTDRFGVDVRHSDVLDINPDNAAATLVADLVSTEGLPKERFDCFILTQTLQFIDDVGAAIDNAHRMLRPGGVLLITAPAASRITTPPVKDYWRFTPDGMLLLLNRSFGVDSVDVEGQGNVLTQIAFLEGLAAEELMAAELQKHDELSPLIVCARAVKPRDRDPGGRRAEV